MLWDGSAFPAATLQAAAAEAGVVSGSGTPSSRLLLEVTGTAPATTAAAFAAPPMWALALLGASVAATALVQLWHCLPHRSLLRRASELEQTAAVPVTAAAAAGSADLEAAWAGEAQPSALAPLKTRPSAAAGMWPPLPGSIPIGPPRPVSVGSLAPGRPAALNSPMLHSPSSPGAAAWAPVDVDASVRARDLTRHGWVPTAPAGRRPTNGKASTTQPQSPLFSPTRSGRPAAEAWEAAETWEEAGSPRAGSASGSPRDQAGSDWRAKSARLDRGVSEVAAADFRLLASALPAPSSAASGSGGGSSPVQRQRPGSPGKRPSSPLKRTASAPGSPSKAGRGPAPRKLTGAKSVGPQELQLDGEEWEEGEGAAALLPASPAPAPASLLTATASHSSGSRPPSPTALSSVRLLSAQQLQVRGEWLQRRWSAPDLALRCLTLTACSSPLLPNTVGHAAGRPAGRGRRRLRVRGRVGGAAVRRQAAAPLERRRPPAGPVSCLLALWPTRLSCLRRSVACPLCPLASPHPPISCREVEVMAAVGRHPHVVSLLAACLEPPRLALVQELAPTSLHDLLHRERRRPQYGALLAAAEALAAALHHLHTLLPPLVHRDLSAKNVLMGADGRMRLADFGLAKRRRGEGLSPDQVGPGSLGRGCACALAPTTSATAPLRTPLLCTSSPSLSSSISSPLPAGGRAGHRCLHGARSHAGGDHHRGGRRLGVGGARLGGEAGWGCCCER